MLCSGGFSAAIQVCATAAVVITFQIVLFQLVSLPIIAAAALRAFFDIEIWWVTHGCFLFYMTNTSLDAIDTLYIVKPYRRAFIQMTRSILRK